MPTDRDNVALNQFNLTPTQIAELERLADSDGPTYTLEEVFVYLRELEASGLSREEFSRSPRGKQLRPEQ